MIPQHPVVFSGTVRSNLVGVDKSFQDKQLWAVLEMVGLTKILLNMELDLDSDVGNAGSALSSGLQQLLCLARALLRRCHILALDESTAHVDAATEEIFKSVLRGPVLGQSRPTMLSVAHRPESLTV